MRGRLRRLTAHCGGENRGAIKSSRIITSQEIPAGRRPGHPKEGRGKGEKGWRLTCEGDEVVDLVLDHRGRDKQDEKGKGNRVRDVARPMPSAVKKGKGKWSPLCNPESVGCRETCLRREVQGVEKAELAKGSHRQRQGSARRARV